MADLIQLLPDSIANQIAAGEVIQRPASVVKELMENAIDAGADHIKLIIKDSGKTLIQIIDNGCGMSEPDARMSFERHATSKLRQANDLFQIRTMGFRGEALASIAAIAHVEMKTRRHADELGIRLLIEGSEVKTQEPCQCMSGTSIAVKNLFYNVPARRNFLKSNSVEMRHIIDEFQRIALAHPDLFFSLHHNDVENFHLTPGNLRQRTVGLFGTTYNKRLVPVAEETDILKISGFVGKPEFAKKTRGEQFFFVNRRFIKSGFLHHAIVSAYDELLPKGVHPFYLLFFEMDPARIDVNVHPTKQEIKFDDERLVYNYLKVAVRHALGQHSVTPTLDFEQGGSFSPTRMGSSPAPAYPTVQSSMNKEASGAKASRSSSSGFTPEQSNQRTANNRRNWEKLYEGLGDATEEEEALSFPTTDDAPLSGSITLESKLSELDEQDSSVSSRIAKAPYQLHQRYIVSQIKSGFLLIDQQAAHERILYEQYIEALEQQKAVSQRQLFARNIQLPPAEAVLLQDMLEELNLLGFDIEEFGQNAFVINGLPAEIAGKQNEEKVIDSLIEQYRFNQEMKLDARENIARAMAKSAAIKAGQTLSVAEMENLINRLFACQVPFSSPSGRHCFLTFELDELDQRFER